MRIVTILAVGLFLLASGSGTGHCQLPTHILYLHAGASLPLAPAGFSDYRSPGFQTGIGVGFPKSDRLQMLIGLDHSRNPVDEGAVAEKSGLSRSDVVDIPGTVSWWTVTLGLRANSHRPLIGSAVPYVHGSLAFVHMRGSTPPLLTQSPTFDPAEMALKQTTAGGVIGAGLEFDVGERVDFYLEARLAMGVGGETTMFMPVVAGIAIR